MDRLYAFSTVCMSYPYSDEQDETDKRALVGERDPFELRTSEIYCM